MCSFKEEIIFIKNIFNKFFLQIMTMNTSRRFLNLILLPCLLFLQTLVLVSLRTCLQRRWKMVLSCPAALVVDLALMMSRRLSIASDVILQYVILYLAILTICVSCATIKSKLIVKEKMLEEKRVSKQTRCWSSQGKYLLNT